jgi:hypothetical protein
VNRAAQEFALLAFLREWFTHQVEWPAEYAKSHPDACTELAPQTIAVEALLWLRWGVELGLFPSDSLAILAESQQTELGHAVSIVANESAYKLPVGATSDPGADALVAQGGYARAESLHPHFQHLAMMAARFANQDPATMMLATITVERPAGKFSYYELPKVVAKLSAADVAAALEPWRDSKRKSGPSLAGAFGIAGVLQTLEYFAAVENFFATLSRLAARGTPLPTSDASAGESSPLLLTPGDVMHFQRRFVACQGWRIDLRNAQVSRRFDTLIDFAATFIREELTVDAGRVMQHVVSRRGSPDASDNEQALDLLMMEFNPKEAVSEWRNEARRLAADWLSRLRGDRHIDFDLDWDSQAFERAQEQQRLRGVEE